MTELELYKYVTDNTIEWHWENNNGEQDVVLLPYTFQMEGFAKLIEGMDIDEGVICRLQSNYFAVWMNEICEYYGIGIENVFPKES